MTGIAYPVLLRWVKLALTAACCNSTTDDQIDHCKRDLCCVIVSEVPCPRPRSGGMISRSLKSSYVATTRTHDHIRKALCVEGSVCLIDSRRFVVTNVFLVSRVVRAP